MIIFLFFFLFHTIYSISIIFHLFVMNENGKISKTITRSSNIIEIVTSSPRIFISSPLFLLYCRTVLFHCLPLLCFPSCFCRVVALRLVVRFLFLHRLVFFSTVSTAFSLLFLFPYPSTSRPFLPFSTISFLLPSLSLPFFFSFPLSTRGLHPSSR